MTVLLSAFLVAHGLVHLAIWLPHPEPDPAKPPPFVPEHSAVLTKVHVPPATTRRVAQLLAWLAAATMVLAGVGVLVGAGWAAPAAVTGAVAGLVLKGLYFNRWLSLGVLLDVLVLAFALAAWPVPLT